MTTAQALTGAEQRVQQAQQELQQADARRRQIATEVEALLNLRQQQWQENSRFPEVAFSAWGRERLRLLRSGR